MRDAAGAAAAMSASAGFVAVGAGAAVGAVVGAITGPSAATCTERTKGDFLGPAFCGKEWSSMAGAGWGGIAAGIGGLGVAAVSKKHRAAGLTAAAVVATLFGLSAIYVKAKGRPLSAALPGPIT